MRFAIDKEGKRILPCKGGRAFCPLCEKPVRARCGNIRVHHWYHESLEECSYTNYTHIHETPWHLHWKNLFPANWQEIIHKDSNGEKHISDVQTPHRLTIEFQHSPISEEERISRETFYSSIRRMIWVVDGSKNKHDWNRWYNSRLLRESSFPLPGGGVVVDNAREMLPAEWLYCTVPVFFDFLGIEPLNATIPEKRELICVLCRNDKAKHLFIPINHELFIALCQSGELFLWMQSQLPTVKPQAHPATNRTHPVPMKISSPPIPRSRGQFYRDRKLDEMLGITSPHPRYKKKNKRQSISKKKRYR
ncbi:MAG: hypothetical protein IKJ34_01505 [Mailhella sp.]|nr:hypothetical protein [Mailhella sp.]